jgi:hypothetical protein
MASIPEAFDSDEMSEISSIHSTDTEPLPKTPKTRNDPKRFVFRGEEFVEVKNVAKPVRKGKGRKGKGKTEEDQKTSMIWKLGKEVERLSDGKAHWLCGICKAKGITTVFSSEATSGPRRHLEKHGITQHNGRLFHKKGQKSPTGDSSRGQSPAVGSFLSVPSFDEFRLLFLQWLICCHVALSMVENPFFRKLIEFINRLFIDFLPSSKNTIRKWVLEEHERQKALKRKKLLQARSRITISFDAWTSPFSKKHVLSIIAHFVDENWKRQHLQLSMGRLYGGHSGKNLAHHILPVLRDWGIASRLGYFVTDNEASNGTAVDHILQVLEPETYQHLKTNKRKKAELRKRWIRCLAHTINLICQSFLLGKDPEKFLIDIDGAELTGDLDKLQMLWRKRGFIGKLSNIIRYIRRSPSQREQFERIRINDEADDVYWIAVEEVEDDEQLEVRHSPKLHQWY